MALMRKLKPGDPIRKIGAKWVEDVSEILDKLEGIGCTIERSGNRWKINTDTATVAGLADGTTQYEVLSWRADGATNTWQPDWVRAHA